MKYILVILAALSLVACSQSSNSGGGVAPKAEKLNADISREINNFVANERAFGEFVSGVVSGDDSFAADAPAEILNECEIESSYGGIARGISAWTFVISGKECPVQANAKIVYSGVFWYATDDVLESWDNSYLVQAKDYQEKYGFTAIAVKNNLTVKASKKSHMTWDYSYSLIDGSVVTANFSAESISSTSEGGYQNSVVLKMGNNEIKYSEKKTRQNTKKEYICKFNDTSLAQKECAETGIEELLNTDTWRWREIYAY